MRDTFLLTWNPSLWPTEPDEREEFERQWAADVEQTRQGLDVAARWSTGSRVYEIEPGDRAFLLRQHDDRGIVAAGEFTSIVFPDEHWDGSGDEANYATVKWSAVLAPKDRLAIDTLKSEVGAVAWDRLQGSGVKVANADAQLKLEELWEAHLLDLDREPARIPEEVSPSDTFIEGAVARIEVNRYERDQRAREACLLRWGHTCRVCGFDFHAVYGELGTGYMHVHHVTELASIGADYEVDPIKDLQPVCPNCHAMLHRQRPALTIEKLKQHLSR